MRKYLLTYMAAETRRDIFQAIVDPTRRQIVNLIAENGMTLNRIADNFQISRPAVSQHVKILYDCGVITIRQQGRERYCEAKLDSLKEVFDWVNQYKTFWNEKLDSLDSYINKVQASKKLKEDGK